MLWSEKPAVGELERPTRLAIRQHTIRQNASYELGVAASGIVNVKLRSDIPSLCFWPSSTWQQATSLMTLMF
jgi:hypothetical protein